MKNPFVEMAAFAALMMPAMQENVLRSAGKYTYAAPGRNRLIGRRNPAGAKLVRQFYRAKHRTKADYATARQWYCESR